MSLRITQFLPWLLFWALCSSLAAAQTQPVESLDQLLLEVRHDRAADALWNEERERCFLAEKDKQQRLEEAKAALQAERQRSETLQRAFDQNTRQLAELQARMQERAEHLTDVLAVARQVAGEAKAAFDDSLVSTQIAGRAAAMDAIAHGDLMQSTQRLEDLWLALQQEMTESGKVVSYTAKVIAADGTEQERRATRIGTFTQSPTANSCATFPRPTARGAAAPVGGALPAPGGRSAAGERADHADGHRSVAWGCALPAGQGAGRKRYTTAELIEEESEWAGEPVVPTQARSLPSLQLLGVRVEYWETELREKVKAAGGIWRPRHKLWEIRYEDIVALEIESRVVAGDDPHSEA